MKIATDILQSKLVEILPIESADMFWLVTSKPKLHVRDDEPLSNYDRWEHYPAWSLSALMSVLPEGIIENYYAPNLQKENGKYSIAYGNDELLCIADNPVDVCYEMIIKLHEMDLI